MNRRIIQGIVALALALTLLGCADDQPLRVSSKDFGESKILSEMIAALAEKEQIPVRRMIGLGPTRLNLEALKRGEADVYVDYNGTGLVMLGQPAMADGDAAMEKVRRLYEPLGLRWGQRLGFANNYAILMRADRAEALGVRSISDLVGKAGNLTIGIDENFQGRPLDGFQPMTRRYGLSFGNVRAVAPDRRPRLYDLLLAGEVDVIEGFLTDGQIADYELVVLEDDLDFFPVYQAAPLYRIAALESHPALASVLDSLAGRLDEETMRELNRRVDLQGQAPAAVARGALAEMGLLEDGEGLAVTAPLRVAAAPFAEARGTVGEALRAIRETFQGRIVELLPAHDPLTAVRTGDARLALVGAHEFTEPVTGQPSGNFEAVGLVGETTVHVFALKDGITRMQDVTSIAVGAPDSVAARTARMLADGLGLDVSLVSTPGDDARTVADAMRLSVADAAIVVAPLGNEIATRLAAAGARLLSLEGWDQGNNLIRYPALRQARIPAATYAGQNDAVETLASQLLLAAVGPRETSAAGDRGPGASYTESAEPLADAKVTALNEALGSRVEIDPAVRQASVLAPRLPDPPQALNPAPDQSILNVVVIALMIWLLWVYVRPERR